MSTTSRTRSSVQSGACFKEDGNDAGCALVASSCEGFSDFFSSREIQNVASAHGGKCLKSDFVNGIAIGSCGTYCASDPSLCASSTDWNQPGSEGASGCTVVWDGIRITETKYGLCGDTDCAWSKDGCTESFLVSPSCTCEKVRTGACVDKEGHVFCSISPESCDENTEWMSPKTLSVSSNVDCFLCREFGNSDVESISVTPPASVSGDTSGSNSSSAALIGGIVGGLIAFGIFLAALVVVVGRKRAQSRAQAEIEKPELDAQVDVASNQITCSGDDVVSEMGDFVVEEAKHIGTPFSTTYHGSPK